MNQNNESGAQVGEREIVITRVLDAPRDLVFDAWTKEEYLSKWWGPQGFTLTLQKFEMKPGGTWQFIMHGPDGVDYPNTNVFVEVVKPERIVIKHDVFPHFLATAIFEDLDGCVLQVENAQLCSQNCLSTCQPFETTKESYPLPV